MNCVCKTQQVTIDCFTCCVCKDRSHWKCYGYTIVDKQPSKMRCLKCQLAAFDPFNKVVGFVPVENRLCLIIDRQSKVNVVLKFTAIQGQSLAIFCTKQKAKQLHEWPSKNIFFLLNKNHHIRYQDSLAQIQFNQLGPQNILQVTADAFEEPAFLGIVIIQQQSLMTIKKALVEDIDEEYINRVQEQYKNKLVELRKTEDVIAEEYIKITIQDQYTFSQLTNPCRGVDCKHMNCFELQTYLIMQQKALRWRCPICDAITPIDSLLIDVVLHQIISELIIDYPQNSQLIRTIAILDEQFNYTIQDPTYIAKAREAQEQLFHNSKIFIKKIEVKEVKDVPLQNTITEFLSRDSDNRMSLSGAKKMLRLLIQKNVLSKVVALPQYKEFILGLFDIGNYHSTNVFEESVYLNQLVSFELICREIQLYTVSGLIAHFLFNLPIEITEQWKLLIIFAFDQDKLQMNAPKLIELILAFGFQPKSGDCPGQIINKVLMFLYNDRPLDHANVIRYLVQHFSLLFYSGQANQIIMLKNCQCLAYLLSPLDAFVLKEIYTLDCVSLYRTQLSILLYLIQLIRYGELLVQEKYDYLLSSSDFTNYGLPKQSYTLKYIYLLQN